MFTLSFDQVYPDPLKTSKLGSKFVLFKCKCVRILLSRTKMSTTKIMLN